VGRGRGDSRSVCAPNPSTNKKTAHRQNRVLQTTHPPTTQNYQRSHKDTHNRPNHAIAVIILAETHRSRHKWGDSSCGMGGPGGGVVTQSTKKAYNETTQHQGRCEGRSGAPLPNWSNPAAYQSQCANGGGSPWRWVGVWVVGEVGLCHRGVLGAVHWVPRMPDSQPGCRPDTITIKQKNNNPQDRLNVQLKS